MSLLGSSYNTVPTVVSALSGQRLRQLRSPTTPLSPTVVELPPLPEDGERVVAIVGYSSATDVLGYGRVNGFELCFAGGGTMQHGRCKGRRSAFELGAGEYLVRVAGRTDQGRRGASSFDELCLVSLQFTTSRMREAIFGLSVRTKGPGGVFSFAAAAAHHIVGAQTIASGCPVVVAVRQAPKQRRERLPMLGPGGGAPGRLIGAAPPARLPPDGTSAADPSAPSGADPARVVGAGLLAAGRPAEGGRARGPADESGGPAASALARPEHLLAIGAALESAGQRAARLHEAFGGHGEAPGPGAPPGPRGEAAMRQARSELSGLDEAHAALRSHVGALVDAQACKVCLDAPIGGVLVPCGHLGLCKACASRLVVGSACPFCRTPLTSFALTFSA